MKPHDIPADVLTRQAQWLRDYRFAPRVQELGHVVAVGDGVVWVQGLPSAALEDGLAFADGSRGVVFHLGEDRIGAILLQETPELAAGTEACLTRRRLSLPVGDELLGRVIDSLGNPLDGRPAPECRRRRPLEVPSPPITARTFVDRPLYSGLKIVDTLIPMGRGQRQLIIGDEGSGKTALALDTVLSQRGRGVNCVYVLVGQKRSAVVEVLEVLRDQGALDYTVLVVAEGSALPGLAFYAPFAGAAVAEDFMARGRDTLVVYDDLTAHALTYRELSLLLKRPPGREAYPGDIFYLHARLLERATALAHDHGGGSMTALPIVQTQQGEIAAFIPTNLISITDGQLYLDPDLFAAGFRPAVDITRSVSRIGGKAQHPRIKQEAGRIKLDYLQFLELEAFSRFGARLDPAMAARLTRGRLLRQLLKQDRLEPLAETFQLAWLLAYNEGLLEGVPLEAVPEKLALMRTRLEGSNLTLEDDRNRWLQNLRTWLEESQP